MAADELAATLRAAAADVLPGFPVVFAYLYGSRTGERSRPDSDVDVLVTFASGVEWSLFDHIAMEEELSALLGRKVDLVSGRVIELSSNLMRRKTILETAEPFYCAR